MKDNPQFHPNMPLRAGKGLAWSVVFFLATLIGVLVLIQLLWSIVDQSTGLVILEDSVPRTTLVTADGRPFTEASPEELVQILQAGVSRGRFRVLNNEAPMDSRCAEDLRELIVLEIARPRVREAFRLAESLFAGERAYKLRDELYPTALVQWRVWLNLDFLTSGQSTYALAAGLRPAIIGSLWVILFAILFAFPVGIGAAIYLEEYARDTKVTRFLQTNIYNLAGVPSIIYGMLGLAFFVRGLEPLTSGSIFGVTEAGSTANGRTILSAGLTMSLLILPVIIINAQEALRAVPSSLRQSSYGVGATKWQTIWHHVLPASFDRILTGTVFAISRAIGETAPLVVVGASTFLTLDPNGPFSKFTALPIQIYQWSSIPQQEFRFVAGAAILVLLTLLLGLNSVAIVMRNRIRKQKEVG